MRIWFLMPFSIAVSSAGINPAVAAWQLAVTTFRTLAATRVATAQTKPLPANSSQVTV